MILCEAHRKGVTPGARKFYTANCPTCERKLAAGQVAITDPPQPETRRELRGRHPNYGRPPKMYRPT